MPVLAPLFLPAQVNIDCYRKAEEKFKKGLYTDARQSIDTCLASVLPGKTDSLFHASKELQGRCCLSTSDLDKATEIFLDLAKADSLEQGADHPITLADRYYITECYYESGNYKKALPLCREVLLNRLKSLGDQHPDYASSLNQLALILTDLGNYDTASILFNQVLLIRRSALGKDHPDYASSLDNLAVLYYSTGKYRDGILLLEEALRIRRKALGEKHPDYAETLNNLAAFHYVLGEYEAALPLYRESCSIDLEKLGNKNPDYAIDLNNLALLYARLGRYREALPLYREASQIYKSSGVNDNLHYANTLCNLADLYVDLGIYDSAFAMYEVVKQIRLTVLGKKHTDYIKTLNNMAFLYNKLGESEKALPLYQEVSLTNKEILGTRNAEYARSLNNLAYTFSLTGNYDAALPLFEESLRINKEVLGTGHTDYAAALTNLAIVYSDMGNYNSAISLLEEATDIEKKALGPASPIYALNLVTLANHYSDLSMDTSGINLLKEAVQILKDADGVKHADYAMAIQSLARAYQLTGNYDAAVPLFKNAADIYLEALGAMHPDYARVIRNQALLFKETGNLSESIAYMKKAVKIYRESLGTHHPDYVFSLFDLAESYMQSGDLDSAYTLLLELNSITNQSLQDYFSFLSEEEKRKYLAKASSFYDLFLSYLKMLPAPSSTLNEQAFDNELLLKGVVLTSVSAMQQAIIDSKDTVLIADYEKMRLMKRQLNYWLQKPVSEREINTTNLENEIHNLEISLTRRSKVFSELQASFHVRWNEIQKQLKPKQAAIEFISFHQITNSKQDGKIIYGALLLRKEDPYPNLVFLGEETLLKQIIPRIGASPQEINASYNSTALYSAVWKPLESYLKGIDTIYFSPSGILNRVSMSAPSLCDSLNLMDKFSLVQLSSTRILALPLHDHLVNSAVVYGGINYDTDTIALKNSAAKFGSKDLSQPESSPNPGNLSRGGFRYLPGTLKEAELISAMLKNKGIQTTLYSGNEAVEESFVSLSGDKAPALIHIATHGFYYPDSINEITKKISLLTKGGSAFYRFSSDPLFRSGLLMAGSNQSWKGMSLPEGVEDGILTAREVSYMNLLNTELVALSACQTGQGDVKGSEGVEGLERGFKLAGVHYLLMSLWEIPDKETTEFMSAFYDHWLGGMQIKNAFKTTQMELRKKYLKEPYKWAGFILVE